MSGDKGDGVQPTAARPSYVGSVARGAYGLLRMPVISLGLVAGLAFSAYKCADRGNELDELANVRKRSAAVSEAAQITFSNPGQASEADLEKIAKKYHVLAGDIAKDPLYMSIHAQDAAQEATELRVKELSTANETLGKALTQANEAYMEQANELEQLKSAPQVKAETEATSTWQPVQYSAEQVTALRSGYDAAMAKCEPFWHDVVSGNTLSQIADIYDVQVGQIQSANTMRGTQIFAGQELQIPTCVNGEEAAPPQTLEDCLQVKGFQDALAYLQRGQKDYDSALAKAQEDDAALHKQIRKLGNNGYTDKEVSTIRATVESQQRAVSGKEAELQQIVDHLKLCDPKTDTAPYAATQLDAYTQLLAHLQSHDSAFYTLSGLSGKERKAATKDIRQAYGQKAVKESKEAKHEKRKAKKQEIADSKAEKKERKKERLEELVEARIAAVPQNSVLHQITVGPSKKKQVPLSAFVMDGEAVPTIFVADKRFVAQYVGGDHNVGLVYSRGLAPFGIVAEGDEVKFGKNGKEQYDPKKGVQTFDQRIDAGKKVDLRTQQRPGEKVMSGFRSSEFDPNRRYLTLDGAPNGDIIAEIVTFRGQHPWQRVGWAALSAATGMAIQGALDDPTVINVPPLPDDGNGSP